MALYNINSGGRSLYAKCSICNVFSTAHDCMSVMHYRDWGFSTGGPTMTPIIQDCDVRSGNYLMTQSDIELLNKMYQWMVVGVTGQHSLPLVPSVGMVTDTGRRTIHFVIVTYVKHYF